jgi:indole-3-glycerol phosphate synthase
MGVVRLGGPLPRWEPGRTETERQYNRNNAEGQDREIDDRGPTSHVLDRIVATKREEVASSAPARRSCERRRAAPPPRGFRPALRSAARGAAAGRGEAALALGREIRPGADPAEIAREYAAGGAAALSVLTDREYFGGSLEALRAVRAAVELPLLRKDFVIAEEQVWEARAAGADAVLLIVASSTTHAGELHAAAAELGMDVLVEVHDEAELERALAAGAG